MIYDKELFHKFYLENKDKIEQKIQTYPLDEKAFINWINLHEGKIPDEADVNDWSLVHKNRNLYKNEGDFTDVNETYFFDYNKILLQREIHNVENLKTEKDFLSLLEKYKNDNSLYKKACLFREASRHVSLEEFTSQMAKICSNIRGISTDFTNTILVIKSDNMKKSNFWISMLFYGYLYDIITLVTDERDIPILKNSLIIIPDDASYSGSQFAEILSDIMINYIGRDTSLEKATFYCAIPYISERALNHIMNYCDSMIKNLFPGINTNRYTISFGPFESFKSFNKFLIDKGYSYLISYKDLRNDLHTIYFDHKLADSVSVFQFIYALGKPFYNSKITENITLIKGCDYSNHPIYRDLLDEDYSKTDDLQNYGLNHMCPNPFYKNIKYTFENKVLKNLNILRTKN